MKKLLVGLVLMAGSLMAETHFSFGVGVGVPVAPRPYYYAPRPYYAPGPYTYAPPAYYGAPAVVVPPCPGPGYSWIAGSWFWTGGHRSWRPGYWAAPRGRVHGRYGWRHR